MSKTNFGRIYFHGHKRSRYIAMCPGNKIATLSTASTPIKMATAV